MSIVTGKGATVWVRYESMKPLRGSCVVALGIVALVSGCSAVSDTADGPESAQAAVVDDAIKLDGVQLDVRRDPG